MTTHDDLTRLRQLRDAVPPPDPHRRDAARARLVAALEARDPARRPTISRGSGSRVGAQPTPTRPVVAPSRRARLVGALVPAAVALVAVVIAWQMQVAVSTPRPFIGGGGTVVTVHGDGNINCPNHVADDLSLPVGTVQFHPGPGQIRVIVTLTDAAPHRNYTLDLWSDAGCATFSGPEGLPVGAWTSDRVLRTDGEGAGELDHVFTGIDPGVHRVNVNLVTEPEPNDPRHREMGAATFTEVVVDSIATG